MTQRNSFENINKLADAFKNKGSIDVIFDHDGTMMDSSTAEAKRIFAILYAAHPTLLDLLGKNPDDFITDIKKLGYGKNGVWASKLLDKLKQTFPQLADFIDTNAKMLNANIDPDALDELTIQKGMDLEEIPGTVDFVRAVINLNNQVAVFSGNWDEVVYVALNKHLAKVNVFCPTPTGKELNTHAIQLIQNLPQQTSLLHTAASISAFNDAHGQKMRRKPEADGLLMQKFSLLLQRGLVTKDDANKFLTDPTFRSDLSKLANHRQSIYIGDDFIDLKAAINAGFKHFIAVNEAGNEASNQMLSHMQTLPEGTINIIYVANLAEAHDLLFKPMLNHQLQNPADLLPDFLKQAEQKGLRKAAEPAATAPQENRYEDANFDVADDKTVLPRARFGRKGYGEGHEVTLNADDFEKVLKHGTYVILSAEDNPDSKAWLVDAEAFFKEEYRDAPEKFQAYLDTTEEEKRLTWNAINTARLERFLQLFGFRYVKVDGNYGKDEKSFLVFTPLEGSQQIAQMALTDTIQLLQAIGIFLKQDSVLFSRFLSNIYLYTNTQSKDFKKMAYGRGFNYVEPNSPFSSTIKVKDEKGEEEKLGYSLLLDWDNKKMLPDFIRECESTRDDRYKKFSLVHENEKISEKYQADLFALAELRLKMLTSFITDVNNALDKKRMEENKLPTDLADVHIDLATIAAPRELQQDAYRMLMDFFQRIQGNIKEEKRAALLVLLDNLKDLNNNQTYNGMLSLINEFVETIHFHLEAPKLVLEDKASARAPDCLAPREKLFIMTRGIDHYNELAEDLYDYYTSRGYKVAMISSDAHINKIGQDYPWYKFEENIVPKMLACNKMAHTHYLDDKDDSVDIYIYSDMNTDPAYMKNRAKLAIEKGFKPVIVQSSYEINPHLYYLESHLQDSTFRDADYVPLGDGITVPQLKVGCDAEQLLSNNVKSSDVDAVANLLGVFATKDKNTEDKSDLLIPSHILSPSVASASQ